MPPPLSFLVFLGHSGLPKENHGKKRPPGKPVTSRVFLQTLAAAMSLTNCNWPPIEAYCLQPHLAFFGRIGCFAN